MKSIFHRFKALSLKEINHFLEGESTTLTGKNRIVAWRVVKRILAKVKKYINEHLYSAKNNVDDCDSISDILCELETNKDD